MRMLSVDLGQSGALAVWEDNKCVKVHEWSLPYGMYMSHHLVDILSILMEYTKLCSIVVVEKPSRELAYQWILFKDIKNAALDNGCEFVEYITSAIKKEVTGNGRASKEEVQQSVIDSECMDNNVHPESEHGFDAIGCGLCYIRKEC